MFETIPLAKLSRRRLLFVRDELTNLADGNASYMAQRIDSMLSGMEAPDCMIFLKKHGKYIGWSNSHDFRSFLKPGDRKCVMVYVREEFRGKGYGKLLVNKMTEYLRGNGEEKVYADPWSEISKAMYGDLGFIKDPKWAMCSFSYRKEL